MSALIQQALGQLFYRLEDLEASVAAQEQKAARARSAGQPQQDLFGKRSAKGFDPVVVGKRLDSTIEKVEQILKEG